VPGPGTVVMQYTGHSEITGTEPPTYACVGTADGIVSWRTMQARTDAIAAAAVIAHTGALSSIKSVKIPVCENHTPK